MNTNGVLILLIIAAAIVAILAIVLYRAWYQHRINKQLHSETPRTRSFLSPWAFAVILSIAVLTVISVSSSIHAMMNPFPGKNGHFVETLDFRIYGPDEMTGCRSFYSIEENPGYTKKTERQGDVLFTYFIRDDILDYYHPTFIIYVEYLGSRNVGSFVVFEHYVQQVQSADGTTGGTIITEWGFVNPWFDDYFCIIGNPASQTTIDLSVVLYDTDRESENTFESTVARESISIQLPK